MWIVWPPIILGYSFPQVLWSFVIIFFLMRSIMRDNCSVPKLCPIVCDPMNCSTPRFPVLHYLLEFAQNSCPLSHWCYPTISPSIAPFSSWPPSFQASGIFPVSRLFTSGGQSIRASASASVLPMNIQDWSPLGWTGWISLQSKGLSRVFSNTTVQKHQFFSAQLSL